MELYEQIICRALEDGQLRITFSEEPAAFVEGICYRTLSRIREILDDEHLTDTDCFARIEEIVSELEGIGSNGGCRHDF